MHIVKWNLYAFTYVSFCDDNLGYKTMYVQEPVLMDVFVLICVTVSQSSNDLSKLKDKQPLWSKSLSEHVSLFGSVDKLL